MARSPYTVLDGRKIVAVAGTREKLSATEVQISAAIITAETDNSGYVTVGGATVVNTVLTRRGTPLNAGDSVTIRTNLPSNIWIDSENNGDGVSYTLEGRE